jgi:hypothetical protein
VVQRLQGEEERRVVDFAVLEVVVLLGQQKAGACDSDDTQNLIYTFSIWQLAAALMITWEWTTVTLHVASPSSKNSEFSISTSTSCVVSLAASRGPLSGRRPIAASASF